MVSLQELPAGAVGAEIRVPFVGTGVRVRSLFGEVPPANDVQDLARKIGVAAAHQWLYLTYDCWGGSIDFVYGFTSTDGILSTPVEDSSLDTVEATYLDLLSQFGITAAHAFHFAPFARGFWGDDD
jgi:hypothetical protein